jgi:predicted DCC family thiol-disulfide oxidoreductase YuxK
VGADGTVLQDLAVFRAAYELIGLGWIYAPTTWPLVGALAGWLYGLWAHWRLALTRRPNLDTLCACRSEAPLNQH